MRREFDVLIAGGGVMGSACAYFLKARLGFGGTVAVIEADPSYRDAASSRSAGSIRQQFSTAINIRLSAFGMEFLKAAPSALECGGLGREVGLVEASYLLLASAAGAALLERQVSTQRAAGVPVSLRDRAGLARRYPWLNTEDLAAGADCARGEGWFDGHALLAGLRDVARAHGAEYLTDQVLAFERTGHELAGARLERSGSVAARFAVLAAGPRSRALAATVGIELPVVARKRNVFVFSCPTPIAHCPLVVDPSGLWFRPERDRFLCGLPSDPDPDLAPDDFDVDLAEFESRYWPLLAQRVPAFEAIRLESAWAGYYDYNTFDQNAFLGPVPDLPRLLLATGFSGHGIQQAPAVGRALAEYICHGEYRSLDLSELSYARYLRSAPLRELNVI